MLTFTASRGQIPVAIVRNNYLNNWAFKEKIDCLKAVFCGESIRGNHFSWLLDIVFLLISARKDAWFFGFCCSVAGLYDELHSVGKSHQMNNLDSTSDLLWLYTYTFLKQNSLFQLRKRHRNKFVQLYMILWVNCDVLTGVIKGIVHYCKPVFPLWLLQYGIFFIFTKLN